MTESAVSIRCAAWAREEALLPGGTAPRTDVFVLVEHPLPWPGNPTDDPLLATLEAVAAEAAGPERTVRLQAVITDDVGSTRRVVVFAAGGPPFTGYGRSEGAGTVDELPDLVAALVGDSAPPAPGTAATVTDVLVCTHGSRDVCCGSMGTRLWLDVDGSLDDVRLWRTSHTGGHRFAPTAITFPDGNYWAHLDPGVLDGILTRQLPAPEAAAHLRGCAAFEPDVQVADGALLAERGWSWLEAARSGASAGELRVELRYAAGDERGLADVVLEEGRRMPVPDCGGDPADATKFQRELRASAVQAVALPFDA
jgi:hypothetical protein